MKTRPIPNLSRGTCARLDLLAVIAVMVICAALLPTARAQTNARAVPNAQEGKASAPSEDPGSLPSRVRAIEETREKIRGDCIQGRRTICGRILKVLPDGLVVESGYTNLLRPPLDQSWLAPGTAQATRAPNLVEANEPGCVCVGLVFLTDIPKSRSAKPKPYDYIVIQGYPAGQYTYTSVGTTQRTVRRFSALLQTAILVNRGASGVGS
jgi:hypothetical protein